MTQPSETSTPPPLPAILCLHGGGSNSTVFKIQCRRLIWNLKTQFRFMFAQAPYEGAPGTGMLPVFETCAPFYRWVNYKFQLGESDVEIAPAEEVGMIDGLLRRLKDEEGVEEFVGVIGFSQGARLAAGMLLRQKMAERDGRACWTAFKFGVIIGGPFPPIVLEDSVDPKVDYLLLKEIPMVHAWGDKDFVRVGSMELAALCEGDVSFEIEFEGGHHLPLKDRDAADLCDRIRAAWYAGGGRMVVNAGHKY